MMLYKKTHRFIWQWYNNSKLYIVTESIMMTTRKLVWLRVLLIDICWWRGISLCSRPCPCGMCRLPTVLPWACVRGWVTAGVSFKERVGGYVTQRSGLISLSLAYKSRPRCSCSWRGCRRNLLRGARWQRSPANPRDALQCLRHSDEK